MFESPGMVLKYLLITAAMCLSNCVAQDALPDLIDPRIHYNTLEIVCSEGYYVQEHKLETDDGYLLTIYRIPNAKKHAKIPPKRTHYQHVHDGYHPDFRKCVSESRQQAATGPPVLLSHGVLASSDGWILQGSGNDLAFILVDKGYDVWMTNIRGNFYSRRHKTLRPTENKFWDFSFHENGLYDMPKTIDYVLNFTNYQKLTYVGHSMGTTMFFVMASSKPEYNDKIKLFVGMAPVSQIRRKSYDHSKLVVLMAVMDLLKSYERAGVQEFLPRTNLLNSFIKIFCASHSPVQNFCYDSAFSIFGYPSKLFRRKLFPMYLSHGANGVSVKTFFHYDQLLDAPAFQCYDYGPEKNYQKYGQPTPPVYDLKKVTTPTALYYSVDDFVAQSKDVAHMKTILPNVVETQEISKFNHIDFIWAYNAKDRLYPKILETIDKFSNQSK